MISIESKENAEDLLLGATVLGVGGGGSPKLGMEILETDLKAGRHLRVVTVDEVPDDSLIISPYALGSIAPGVKPNKEITIAEPYSKAVGLIERHFGRKAAATVSTEIGGLNIAVALDVAARLNIPLVDGDLLGRAGPEVLQSTAHLFGAPLTPSAIASETGNVVFIEQCADIDDYEALARYVAVVSGGLAAVIDTTMTKSEAAKLVVRDTVSKSIRVGKTIRRSHQEDRDAVNAVREILEGWLIFKGIVEKYEWRNEKGFMFGDATLSGSGEWRGHSFRSWIKNEHILAWRDSKPIVMPPDLIMFLDAHGYGITNDALRGGLEVSVLAARAPKIWRTTRGLELFGPNHFGFDYSYVPVENLIK
jgi:DUF917 family protein